MRCAGFCLFQHETAGPAGTAPGSTDMPAIPAVVVIGIQVNAYHTFFEETCGLILRARGWYRSSTNTSNVRLVTITGNPSSTAIVIVSFSIDTGLCARNTRITRANTATAMCSCRASKPADPAIGIIRCSVDTGHEAKCRSGGTHRCGWYAGAGRTGIPGRAGIIATAAVTCIRVYVETGPSAKS